MKKEIISEVEYKVFCEDFFKEKTLGDNLGCYVKNLTVKEFESFQEKTMTKYYQKNIK